MVQQARDRRASRGSSKMSPPNPFDSDDESPPSRYKNPTSSSYANPFDEPKKVPDQPTARPKGKASFNPFDDDEKEAAAAAGPNPFDDETMWSKRRENSHKPAAAVTPAASVAGNEHDSHSSSSKNHDGSQVRDRRRDKVKERISSISDDVASKASRVTQSSVNLIQSRPRSRNLMQGSAQNRQLLLDAKKNGDHSENSDAFSYEQRKYTHARIERGLKEGDSLEGESVQELESYAIQKAEETTKAVYNALKVAEEIKEGATKTVIMLHEQGEQISRTHDTAVDIDNELSRGEKLLGSLGGLFSKTWKPKKARNITGPVLSRGDSFKRKAYGLEQRTALGLTRSNSRGKTRGGGGGGGAASADSSGMQFKSRIESEKSKQDDALSDLSNVVGQLKEMSIDMGAEIGRQNEGLGYLEGDVTELGYRVKGANERGRRLLGR